MIELVDMCSLQDPAKVDFKAMAASGVRGVWFKSSQYSHDIDTSFAVGVDRAREAGLAVGAYHFCYMGSDPAAQMAFFYRACLGLGEKPGELPPMIDWEYAKNDAMGRPISVQTSVSWLVQAAAAAKQIWYSDVDRLPTIYTYPDFAKQRQPVLGEAGSLGKYPLTLAAYPDLVTPPKPWTKATVHQYSGNGGKVPGVATDCDRDRFVGTEEEFRAFLGTVDLTKPVVEFSGGTVHPLGYGDE